MNSKITTNRLKTVVNILLMLTIMFIMVAYAQAQQTAKVVRVIDGDTIKVIYGGIEQSVRLIGIDTPESRANNKANKDAMRSGQDVSTITAMGKQATEYVKSMVKKGDTLRLEFDVARTDKYNRLLAYVYLPDGRMLNEEIIRNGYASILTVPPNVRYQSKFLSAYREARQNSRGLWRPAQPNKERG